MILFNQQLLPLGTLHFMEYEMSNYSRIDIDGTGGRLSFADFPLATVAIVGSIIALTLFLLAFLLVSF
jgi:hypothetical protein